MEVKQQAAVIDPTLCAGQYARVTAGELYPAANPVGFDFQWSATHDIAIEKPITMG
jgi:hypothetical protein